MSKWIKVTKESMEEGGWTLLRIEEGTPLIEGVYDGEFYYSHDRRSPNVLHWNHPVRGHLISEDVHGDLSFVAQFRANELLIKKKRLTRLKHSFS